MIVLSAGLLSSTTAQALGLGAIQSQSALGQPLRLSIPVSAETSEELGCVRISVGEDGLPAPSNMRSVLLQKNQVRLLEISTRQSISEPAISLKVMVGCAVTVTRQYVVLLDPPQTTELPLAPSVPTVNNASNSPLGNSAVRGSAFSAASGIPLTTARRTRPNRPSRPNRGRKPARAGLASSSTAAAGSVAVKLARASSSQPKPALPAFPLSAAPADRADRLVLSTQVEGTALRLNTELSKEAVALAETGARTQPQAPEQINALRQGQTEMVAIVNDQDPIALMAAREAALNSRIRRLTEQAGGLQKQMDALTLRNQTLQQSTLPSYVVWLLGILVLLALTLGTWFAWRYRVLRQTMAGQPWWTARPDAGPETIAAAAAVVNPEVQGTSPSTHRVPSAPARAVKSPTPTPSTSVTANRAIRPAGKSVQARLDAKALSPLGNSTSATDIGGLTRGSHAMELTEHDDFDATQSSFDRLLASQVVQPQLLDKKPAMQPDKEPDKELAKEPDRKLNTRSKDDQKPVDLMLDITSSGLTTPISNRLDFSLATNIQGTQPESSSPMPTPAPMQAATESFFMGMKTEAATPAVNDVSDSSTQTSGKALPPSVLANQNFLQDEDEHDAIATEPLQPVGRDPSSLHVRLVQFTSLLEQIEDMIRRNDTMHTIELLRRYVLHEQNMPTLLWLLLLEQYRKTGKKAVYESFTLHFTQRFGRPAPQWHQTLPDLTPQLTLVEMPDIDDGLKVLWGTYKGLELIERLVCGPQQSDAIVFNATLQRELLQLGPMYPLDKMTKI